MKKKVEWKILRPSIGWLTVPEHILRAVEKYGENPLFKWRTDEGWKSVTYREFFKKINGIVKILRENGIEKGDRIGILGENSFLWASSMLAPGFLGAISVPIDHRLTQYEYRHIVKESEMKLCFVADQKAEEVEEVKDKTGYPEIIIPFKETENIEEESIDYELPALDDDFVILFTSGTTGVSKGVVLTHKNLAANLDEFYQFFIFEPNDVFYLVLPLHHIFALTTSLIAPIMNGSTIVFAKSLRPVDLKRDMIESEPQEFMVVPILLEKLLKGIERELEKKGFVGKLIKGGFSLAGKVIGKSAYYPIRKSLGLHKLKYLISGGAALPEWISKEYEKMGFPILQGYGLSETSPVISVNPPYRPKNKSVGLPFPNLEVKIDTKDGKEGEILVKGPSVMKGYYKNPELTKEVFTDDGFFKTGDIGCIDDEGYLYVTGRKKFIIVTKGGKNVYPEEIEDAILRSKFIQEVLVLPYYDEERKSEEIQAIVYPSFDEINDYLEKKGEKITEEAVKEIVEKEIKRWTKDLADYKKVKRFTIRDEEFPKTTTQKIKRTQFLGEYYKIKKS